MLRRPRPGARGDRPGRSATRRARTFRTVVLPQLRPALLGGALLVGLHLLAEFGALSLLRFPTFTTAIYDQYGSTFNGAAATAMAVVLVLLAWCCCSPSCACAATGGTPGSAAAPPAAPYPSRSARGAGRSSASSVPWWSSPSASPPTRLRALAGRRHVDRVPDRPSWSDALVATVGLALAGAVVTTLAAIPVAWLAVRHRGSASTVIERSTYIANALPGIVVGLALVVASLRLVPAIYQTAALLVAAYVILFLPRAVVTVRARRWSRRPPCSTTSRTASAPARSRPRAG